MAIGRPRLGRRRIALGFTQEALAEQLGADRSTVGRWERGESDPQPFFRPKLCDLLHVTPDELDELLTLETDHEQAPAPTVAVSGSETDLDDDMKRRQMLRLFSVSGALVVFPLSNDDATGEEDIRDVERFRQTNADLWRLYARSGRKRRVYPDASNHLSVLVGALHDARSETVRRRLCALLGDLYQLIGEIYFDSDRYTEATECYALAANASKEAGDRDLWASALTRHAFIGMYERRLTEARDVLAAAERVARRGDPHLSTRHWVAAVQAEVHAGLGDQDASTRCLGIAEQVQSLNEPVSPGGWLRFDGSRLAEERGTCYRQLGRADLAEHALTTALGQKPSPRRAGSILTDLATLGVQRRDVDQVLEYGDRAVDLADRTRSSGYLGRKLQTLSTQLTPILSDARVCQLSDRIAHLKEHA